MPPTPSSPFPHSARPVPSGPCQQRLPFWLPVHHRHWSCHSLSPIVPLPSVICTPNQCRPRTLYNICLLHSPCPQLTPPPPTPSTQHIQPHLLWPIGGLIREGHSPVIPLTDLCSSSTNPSICIYQTLNQTHSAHTSTPDIRHMVSSFTFSNHIVLCHSTRPHESIP